jgi:hypothetical protein
MLSTTIIFIICPKILKTMPQEKSAVSFIEEKAGCSSCDHSDDCLRGPYRTAADAKKRKDCLTRDSNHLSYDIVTYRTEKLADGRVIVNNTRILPPSRMKIARVLPDGTLRGNQNRDYFVKNVHFFEGPEYWEPIKGKDKTSSLESQ